MALRALLTDVLAELALTQEGDELGRQKDADQQRRGARDQHAPHQRLPLGALMACVASSPGAALTRGVAPSPSEAGARSASRTRSSPTPREPLTSTTSPGASRPGT